MTCDCCGAFPARRVSRHAHIRVALALLLVIGVTGATARADLLTSSSVSILAQPAAKKARRSSAVLITSLASRLAELAAQGITNDSSPAGPSKRSGSSETLGEVRSSSGSGGRVVVRQTLEAVEKEAAGEATEEGLEWSDPLAAVRHSPGVKTWRTLTEFVQNCDAPLPTAQQQQEPYLRLGAASSDSVEELLSLGPVQPGVGRNLGQVLHALHIVTWAEGNLSRLSLGELEEMPEFACKARPTHQAGASSQEGRAKRIGILIISSGEPCYAKLSEANKVSYAQRHGYGIHILPPPDPSRHPSWSKVPAVLSLLPLYDWMWVVDTDTLVMTPSVPLTDFIDDDYDLVMTRDCNAVNGGSWLVRNSQWTEALLAQLYARHKAVPSCWWEQSAFIQLTALPGVRERIKVLPNKGLNSYGEGICGDKAAFTKGDLLVHFPGIANKSEVFAKYWRQLQSDADAPWPYQSSEGEGRGLATWFSHLLPTASVGALGYLSTVILLALWGRSPHLRKALDNVLHTCWKGPGARKGRHLGRPGWAL